MTASLKTARLRLTPVSAADLARADRAQGRPTCLRANARRRALAVADRGRTRQRHRRLGPAQHGHVRDLRRRALPGHDRNPGTGRTGAASHCASPSGPKRAAAAWRARPPRPPCATPMTAPAWRRHHRRCARVQFRFAHGAGLDRHGRVRCVPARWPRHAGLRKRAHTAHRLRPAASRATRAPIRASPRSTTRPGPGSILTTLLPLPISVRLAMRNQKRSGQDAPETLQGCHR